MYLLDTNHCSNAILGNKTILKRLELIEDTSIYTCVVVAGELVDMAKRSQQSKANSNLVQNFLQGICILKIDTITANLYGQTKASLFKQFAPKDKSKRRKTKITNLGFGENDLWISAIALQHQLTIVSSDSDFVRIKQVIKNIKIESWL